MTARLDAVGDAGLREALRYARGRSGGFTADDAARSLGLHRNVARSRLDRLVRAGLLGAAFARRTGRSGPGAGRPAKIYTVAPELEAIEFPRRRYELLVGALVDALPEPGRDDKLRRAGERFGRDLAVAAGLRPAVGVEAGLERLCAAVGRLGFQAAVVEMERDRAVLATPTCPLRPVVLCRPETAEVDRGMWAGLAECAIRRVRAEGVDCQTVDCADRHAACRVVLRLQEASASGGTTSR